VHGLKPHLSISMVQVVYMMHGSYACKAATWVQHYKLHGQHTSVPRICNSKTAGPNQDSAHLINAG
jgi:hypothetical protein